MSYMELYSRYLRLASEEPNDAGELPAYCPFHHDTSPSFSFNAETGLWYCFSCGVGGNPYQLLVRLGVPDEEAKRLVREASSIATEEQIQAWAEALWSSATACAYLSSRGVLDEALLRRLRIGYDGKYITIPVYDRDGKVLNIRKLAVLRAKGSPKALNTKGGDNYLWPVQNLNGDGFLYLCAGEIDCLSAMVQGLRAVTATGGESFWRAEWTPLFKDQDVIIAYDGDTPGREGAAKVVSALSGVAKSTAIVQMPDGEDTNSLHVKGVRLDSLPAVSRIKSEDVVGLIDTMAVLSKPTTAQEYSERRGLVAKAIAARPQDEREFLIAKAAKDLGFIKKDLRDAVKYWDNGGEEDASPVSADKPIDLTMSLAQDFKDGIFWYGLWLPTTDTPEGPADFTFRLVTSERKLVKVQRDDLTPPQIHTTSRWSLDSGTPYNVFGWLGGKTEPVQSAALLSEIESVFRRFLWYPDDYSYKVLALWTMCTYVFQVFDTVAYLTFVGTKQSGKSRTQDILAELCYNAIKASSASASSIFRMTELNRPTLLLDEADFIAAKSVDERLNIVLEGYHRPGGAVRVEGDAHVPTYYHVYSPKCFATMNSLPDAIVSRAVALKVLRKAERDKIDNLVFAREADHFQVLRNKLYCWGLENAAALAELQLRVQDEMQQFGVTDREEEVWLGMATIATLCSEDFASLMSYGRQVAREKQADEEGSITTAVIQACFQLLSSERPVEPAPHTFGNGGWYLRCTLRDTIANILDTDPQYISPEKIRLELKKTGIILQNSDFSKQVRHGPARGKRAYLLLNDRVVEAAIRYNIDLGAGFSVIAAGEEC